jgi:hypothetical protein
VNDRGKPDEDSIPTLTAWHHVAKMLFPQEAVRWLTKRDHWLINRYHPPGEPDGVDELGMYYPPPAGERHRFSPPTELVQEIDQAYFRLSLQEEVNRWFVEWGFDLSKPTISKHQFEAAVQADFGRLPPEPVKPLESASAATPPLKTKKLKTKKRAATRKPWAYKRNTADDALVAEGVEGLESKKFPNVWQAAQALAGSDQAKVFRLNRKIGNAYKNLKTPQNISKHLKTNKKR